jgi:hypothetical protein
MATMRALPLLTAVVAATVLFGSGCGGSTAPTNAPAGPSTIAWTVRASTGAVSKWVGASLSGGCIQSPKFQAYAEASGTTPSGNVLFVAAMVLADWPRVGHFELSDSAGAIGVRVLVDSGASMYAPDAAAPGSLTVDTYDPTTRVMTGTFEFESIANTGGLYQAGSIAGSFNFPCLD